VVPLLKYRSNTNPQQQPAKQVPGQLSNCADTPLEQPGAARQQSAASQSSTVSRCGSAPSEGDRAELPPFFVEMLDELDRHKDALGGSQYFKGHAPYIEKKVKARELAASYTDYEYVYLTIVGFARIHVHVGHIVSKMNGQPFHKNPGVQMLEDLAGFTMHGDRDGAAVVLRSAPPILIEGFELAKASIAKGAVDFFSNGFDRNADPCLEGRLGRLMAYVEAHRTAEGGSHQVGPPWEDVSLQHVDATSSPLDFVAEHVRVFMAECTWRWCRQQNMPYDEAKHCRQLDGPMAQSFERLYNATEFELWMLARGAAADSLEGRWESSPAGRHEWAPYDASVSQLIDKANKRC